MKTISICYLTLLLLLVGTSLRAQDLRGNVGKGLLVNMAYGMQMPEGDLKDRFGTNFAVTLGTDWITNDNWLAGVEGSLLFGNEVKQDVLADIRDDRGNIFSSDLSIAFVELRQRGLVIGGHVGRLFSLSKKNKRSGIRLTVGASFFQHKIRVQEDPQAFVPQIAGEYEKGYDRLSNGFALKQFLGYQLLSRNRRINFTAGFDFIQGFTTNQRSWDFNTRQKIDQKRFDVLLGFHLGWTLPFYFGGNEDEIYY